MSRSHDPAAEVPPAAGTEDDVDRLLARLAHVMPPRDFTANVMLATRASQSLRLSRRHIALAVADVAALVALGLLAFLAGQALVGGGFVALMRGFLADQDIVAAMPGDAVLALVEAVPWLELLGLLALSFVVARCTRTLARALGEQPHTAAQPRVP